MARVAAFFAAHAPVAARDLAAAANVPSPFRERAPIDARAVEVAIYHAADRLDVAPRRVRAVLREIAAAVAHAGGTLEDLARLAQDPSESAPDGEPIAHAREREQG